MPFLHIEAHGFCKDVLFIDFYMDSIKFSWYWKFVMQAYCFCIIFTEGKQNMWSPWYLMPQDKPCNVECKFCNNVISYYKDRIFSICAIDMMAMGELELQCVQGLWRPKLMGHLILMTKFSHHRIDGYDFDWCQ